MTYYQAHIRNLEKEAQIQRELQLAKNQQSRISYSRIQNQLYGDKPLRISRKRQDEQTSVFLRRSRYQAELDASTVSTNAILTRSRLESAFQLRQSKQHLRQETLANIQAQINYQNKIRALEEQQYLQTKRQIELNQIRISNIKQQTYQKELQYQIQMQRKRAQQLQILSSTYSPYSSSFTLYNRNIYYPYGYY